MFHTLSYTFIHFFIRKALPYELYEIPLGIHTIIRAFDLQILKRVKSGRKRKDGDEEKTGKTEARDEGGSVARASGIDAGDPVRLRAGTV